MWYAKRTKMRYDAVDRIAMPPLGAFYDAIIIGLQTATYVLRTSLRSGKRNISKTITNHKPAFPKLHQLLYFI